MAFKLTPEEFSAFLNGDEKVLGQLIDIFQKIIINKCKSYTGILREDAEEITLDIFKKVWDKNASFDSPEHIVKFMSIASRNECLNRLKKNKRLSPKIDPEYQEIPDTSTVDFHAALHEEIMNSQYLLQIIAEIEKLKTKAGEAFRLFYIEQWSLGSIAKHLGIKEKTVRNHIDNAAKKIRGGLKEKYGYDLIFLLALLLCLQKIL